MPEAPRGEQGEREENQPKSIAPPRRTAAGFYFVGIGLVGSALAIVLMGFSQMTDSVSGLQRAVMPGRTEVTLAAGRTTIYLEHRSVVNGVPYELKPDRILCTFADAQRKPLELNQVMGRTKYSYGDYAGRSVFDVSIPAPGTYTIECTGSGVIAVGGGVGTWIVVAVVGGLVPGLGGLALCLVVFLKRRRQARAGVPG